MDSALGQLAPSGLIGWEKLMEITKGINVEFTESTWNFILSQLAFNSQGGVNNLKYAVKFASMSGATVYLVNIYREFSKVGGLTKVNELIHEESEAQLQKVIEAVDTGDVKVVARAIKGDSFDGLARVAKQLEVDLMIVSPQSVDRKDEVYLGSVTGKIIKQTDIPVLILPKDYIFRKVEEIIVVTLEDEDRSTEINSSISTSGD